MVVPATADLLARAVAGMSDDLLTAVLLTARCPVVFAPAMHTEMWEHAATQANVAALRERGCIVLDPASGRLTGPDTGPGRLPEPTELFAVAQRVLSRGTRALAADLAGRTFVVSAGGTREELDPVRYLGNWSSGKQGYALARTAASRGATVTLVAANTELPDPAGVHVIRVSSATQLREAVLSAAAGADAIAMAAAVADYRPAARSDAKIKKTDAAPEPIVLAQNPDIVRDLVAARRRPGQLIVAFGAETGDILANAREKLARKGCDLLVVNQVGNGLAFGTADNEVTVLAADGTEVKLPRAPKDEIADQIWDIVAARLPALTF
jgi:phosphopantothenoylcysteine decarboxylase / phosphopantothenate---cysteine ligase